MTEEKRKSLGAYYTPESVVRTLVRWAARADSDRLLDPSCGDGRFLAAHRRSVGVEQDAAAVAAAARRAPGARIHEGDFFEWAARTRERFDCAAGNPPFIRYQRFSGAARERALVLCSALGAEFTALTSSWAPFLVAAASLLKPGGRMSFVVPAEIGHASYARPLLRYLSRHFAAVTVVAVREKLFPDLSEDAWLLHADGFGSSTGHFLLSLHAKFEPTAAPPSKGVRVSLPEWSRWNHRLRPFLLQRPMRSLYEAVAGEPSTMRLDHVARVGIGYVTGANDFFHLRPSAAREAGIPAGFLHPSVRNGRALTGDTVTKATVRNWTSSDDPVLLLRLTPDQDLPAPVTRYLSTPAAEEAKATYKCRNRDPWYVVPDVRVPDAFLAYMSGNGPALVANEARCVCTNSVHAVSLKTSMSVAELQRLWADEFTRLSCEVEGHPLGGGILKLEPGEANRVLLARRPPRASSDRALIREGFETMRRWRHHGG